MKKIIWILAVLISFELLAGRNPNIIKVDGYKKLLGYKIDEKGYKSYNLTGLRLKSNPGAEVVQNLLNNKYGKFVDLYIEKKKLVRTDLNKVYYKNKLVCEFKNTYFEKTKSGFFKRDICEIENIGKIRARYNYDARKKMSIDLYMEYEIKEVVGNISYPFKVENYSSIPKYLTYDEVLKKGLSKRYKVYNDELGISFESDLKYVYYNGKKVCEFKKYIKKPHCGGNDDYGRTRRIFIEYRIYNAKNAFDNSLFGLTTKSEVHHNVGPHVEFFVSFLNKQFENIKKPRNYALIRTFEGEKIVDNYYMYVPFMEAGLKRSQSILNKNNNREKIKSLIGELLACLKMANSNHECSEKYFVNVNFHSFLEFLKKDESSLDKVIFIKNEAYHYTIQFLSKAAKDLDSHVYLNSYGDLYITSSPSLFHIVLYESPSKVWQVKGYHFTSEGWAFGSIGTDPM